MLIDVVSGEISPLAFKGEVIEGLPLRDSVMAIADASYFGWPVLPEAPSELKVGASPTLKNVDHFMWQLHGPASAIVLEWRDGITGPWMRRIIRDARSDVDFPKREAILCVRVRASNDGGESASSNTVCVNR